MKPLWRDKNFLKEEFYFQDGDFAGKHEKIFVLLERCSLVIVKDVMYSKYLHSISEIKEDLIHENIVNLEKTAISKNETLKRDTRISLTIRHVPKTSKLHLFLGK